LRAPENEQFADVLDGRSIELIAEFGEHGFADGSIITEHANFDQTMGIQRRFSFLDDGRCKAVSADHDDWIKVVGFGAKNFALGGCELYLGHVRIIPARTRKNESQNKK
jgi:hypothetical protein